MLPLLSFFVTVKKQSPKLSQVGTLLLGLVENTGSFINNAALHRRIDFLMRFLFFVFGKPHDDYTTYRLIDCPILFSAFSTGYKFRNLQMIIIHVSDLLIVIISNAAATKHPQTNISPNIIFPV